jgi:hypothetical protein
MKNFTLQVSIERVYEKAHRVGEDLTLHHRLLKTMNKDMENHCISITPSKRSRSSKLLFSIPNHPSYIWQERERDVRVVDPKGLVDKYLGTQDLDTHKALNLSWGLARCKIWFIKRSHWVPLRSMSWDISSKKRASVIIRTKRWETLKGPI